MATTSMAQKFHSQPVPQTRVFRRSGTLVVNVGEKRRKEETRIR